MKNERIIMIVLVLIVGVASFFGGLKYQESKQQSRGRLGAGGQFQAGNRTQTGFRPVSGEIMSADATSITVKLQDGSSKIIVMSDKTQINKAEEAKPEDLKVGQKVAVFGTLNTDGSVTAQSISLNPMNRQMPGEKAPAK